MPRIVFDRTALAGVIVNLLINAQQAVDRAGPAAHRIRVALPTSADHIKVVVSALAWASPNPSATGSSTRS